LVRRRRFISNSAIKRRSLRRHLVVVFRLRCSSRSHFSSQPLPFPFRVCVCNTVELASRSSITAMANHKSRSLRRAAVLLTSIVVASCGGGNSSPNLASPTPVVAPVATTPITTTVTTTPTPPPTPYSGRWSGRYVIERCDGTGSVQDLLCGNARGLFPPGTSLPISMDLTQSGSSVTGTVSLGQITGVVTGAVRSTGLLTLSGIARSGTATATLTHWDTRASGNAMDGFFNFSATYTNVPGNAEIAARLSNVSK
jgi:hypothetical protein